jgi:DNA-nicking Smr family endonuclease
MGNCCAARAGRKRKRDAEDDIETQGIVFCSGKVKTILDKSQPFGFIVPDDGGDDLFFNEGLLGSGHNWHDLKQQVSQSHPQQLPVLFIRAECTGPHEQAKGVVVLSADQKSELRADSDGAILRDALAAFFTRYPHVKASVLRCNREQHHQQQVEERERKVRKREGVHEKLVSTEESLYAKRSVEIKKANDLWAQAQELWNAGKHDESKKLQAQVKECNRRAQEYKEEAVKLEREANEKMFLYVMSTEHRGRVQDGTWIDLHGLTADFAEDKVKALLVAARQNGIGVVEVITGAGHHSADGRAHIKPKVRALLQNPPADLGSLTFTEENDGAFMVTLPVNAAGTCVLS